MGVKLSIRGLPREFNTLQEVGGEVAEEHGGNCDRLVKGKLTFDFKRLLEVAGVAFGSMVNIGTNS